MKKRLNKKEHIHFIGIGGVGMSAIALILNSKGYSISGSDRLEKSQFKNLKNTQIKFFANQKAENIKSVCKESDQNPLIVISSAIPSSNPELIEAKNLNLEILHRSELLAMLIQEQPGIAIAGSHGKTSTSTILTTLLALAGKDPTAIIGGNVPYFNSNAHFGSGKFLVAEADESDGSLINFKPAISLITNLELDHTDYYKNLDELMETMKIFERNSKIIIGNYDCKNIRENIKASYWFSTKTKKNIDLSAIPVKVTENYTRAKIYMKEKALGTIDIPLPGIHNLSNTIAAILCCIVTGITFDELKSIISQISLPGRRFEFRGIWKGRDIIDDYAHHPSEVLATIKLGRLIVDSAKNNINKSAKRLVVVFEPHRYTRLNQFLKEFAINLGKADCIFIAPIYSAGEKNTTNINEKDIEKHIKNYYPDKLVWSAKNMEELICLINQNTIDNDLIIAMGAGYINKLWEELHRQIISI